MSLAGLGSILLFLSEVALVTAGAAPYYNRSSIRSTTTSRSVSSSSSISPPVPPPSVSVLSAELSTSPSVSALSVPNVSRWVLVSASTSTYVDSSFISSLPIRSFSSSSPSLNGVSTSPRQTYAIATLERSSIVPKRENSEKEQSKSVTARSSGLVLSTPLSGLVKSSLRSSTQRSSSKPFYSTAKTAYHLSHSLSAAYQGLSVGLNSVLPTSVKASAVVTGPSASSSRASGLALQDSKALSITVHSIPVPSSAFVSQSTGVFLASHTRSPRISEASGHTHSLSSETISSPRPKSIATTYSVSLSRTHASAWRPSISTALRPSVSTTARLTLSSQSLKVFKPVTASPARSAVIGNAESHSGLTKPRSKASQSATQFGGSGITSSSRQFKVYESRSRLHLSIDSLYPNMETASLKSFLTQPVSGTAYSWTVDSNSSKVSTTSGSISSVPTAISPLFSTPASSHLESRLGPRVPTQLLDYTVVTAYTTYCANPTTFTYKHQTMSVSTSSLVTIIECPCTLTRVSKTGSWALVTETSGSASSSVSAGYASPQSTASQLIGTSLTASVAATSVATAELNPASTSGVTTIIVKATKTVTIAAKQSTRSTLAPSSHQVPFTDQKPVLTTTVSTLTTVCSTSTTFAVQSRSYTVSSAATLTIFDCVLTRAGPSLAWQIAVDTPSIPKPSASSAIGRTTYSSTRTQQLFTCVTSSFHTQYYSPTTVVYNSRTYSVSGPTVLTITDYPCALTHSVTDTPSSGQETSYFLGRSTIVADTSSKLAPATTAGSASGLHSSILTESTSRDNKGSQEIHPSSMTFSSSVSQNAIDSTDGTTQVNSIQSLSSIRPRPEQMSVTVVSKFTTFCLTPTTFTIKSVTYSVSSPTTLTITDCPCTVTRAESSLGSTATTNILVEETGGKSTTISPTGVVSANSHLTGGFTISVPSATQAASTLHSTYSSAPTDALVTGLWIATATTQQVTRPQPAATQTSQEESTGLKTFTTYCSTPTTFTVGDNVYTAKVPTDLIITCSLSAKTTGVPVTSVTSPQSSTYAAGFSGPTSVQSTALPYVSLAPSVTATCPSATFTFGSRLYTASGSAEFSLLTSVPTVSLSSERTLVSIAVGLSTDSETYVSSALFGSLTTTLQESITASSSKATTAPTTWPESTASSSIAVPSADLNSNSAQNQPQYTPTLIRATSDERTTIHQPIRTKTLILHGTIPASATVPSDWASNAGTSLTESSVYVLSDVSNGGSIGTWAQVPFSTTTEGSGSVSTYPVPEATSVANGIQPVSGPSPRTANLPGISIGNPPSPSTDIPTSIPVSIAVGVQTSLPAGTVTPVTPPNSGVGNGGSVALNNRARRIRSHSFFLTFPLLIAYLA